MVDDILEAACADCGMKCPDFLEESHRSRCGHGCPVIAVRKCFFEEGIVSPGTKGRILEKTGYGCLIRWDGINFPQWTDKLLFKEAKDVSAK